MQIPGKYELVSWKQPSISARVEVLSSFQARALYSVYIAVSTAFWELCTCVCTIGKLVSACVSLGLEVRKEPS